MNRRDFLKATAAITACAAPPAGRWAFAYRAFRVASRERFIEYDPRAVLRDFGRPKSGLLAGEMGLADGVTFIKTA